MIFLSWIKKMFLQVLVTRKLKSQIQCTNCSCSPEEPLAKTGQEGWNRKNLSRRGMLKALLGVVSTAVACSTLLSKEGTKRRALIKWEEFFQTNYRLMTQKERDRVVRRFEEKAALTRGVNVNIKSTPAQSGVLFGYALNISACQGYRDCVQACMLENNLDEQMATQYIRVFEIKNGKFDVGSGEAEYDHEVPEAGNFYLPMQCMHCEEPPCVPVCPVGATWKEDDGIVVVDYNWCIGCRYCEAACPYWARRFNWQEPSVPNEKLNRDQHYLSNRDRMAGVVEKCHFCVHRTREGRQPACAEACPTGARIFGNLLDPKSEIRWILENKKVFRLKEELGAEPKFWYFMD